MKTPRIIIKTCLVALLGISVASCVTTRKVAYLQDMEHNSQIELENKFEAVISPYDELDVVITCYDSELAKPFNIQSFVPNGIRANGNQTIGYLVDQNGDIELPVLGTVHAAGKTRLVLQKEIEKMLVGGGYLKDPFVMVRFRDFKIFFLGSNGGKAITVPNERCTFLEALALSGDLNIYTNRKKIAVMREVDGKMTMRYLDPRSSKVFSDPYFMLQQNDFIITRDFGYKNFLSSYSNWGPLLSIVSTGVSIATAYFAVMSYRNTSNK